MKVRTFVAAVLLALGSVQGSWALSGGPSDPRPGDAKREQPKSTPAAKPKAKSGAANKLDESSLGSAARREMLKNRMQAQSKLEKKKPAALKKPKKKS